MSPQPQCWSETSSHCEKEPCCQPLHPDGVVGRQCWGSSKTQTPTRGFVTVNECQVLLLLLQNHQFLRWFSAELPVCQRLFKPSQLIVAASPPLPHVGINESLSRTSLSFSDRTTDWLYLLNKTDLNPSPPPAPQEKKVQHREIYKEKQNSKVLFSAYIKLT